MNGEQPRNKDLMRTPFRAKLFSKCLYVLMLIIYSLLIFVYFVTGWEGSLKFSVLMLPLSIVMWNITLLHEGKPLLPKVKNKIVNSVVSITSIIFSLIGGLYLYREFWDLVIKRSGSPTPPDLLAGAILVFLVLLYGATRYPIIFAIALFFIVNALYGNFFPGILRNPGLSYVRVLSALSVDFYSGIFESLTQIALTYVSTFMFFAAVIKEMGLVASVMKIALTKIKNPQHIPLINIIVGIPTGMVVGSAAAGSATIGSLTIPLVNKAGVPLTLAAAMAAAVGVGALLMPPIMSAIAFIMADALGTSYFEVAVRAFVPALVYYVGILIATYHLSRKFIKRQPNTPQIQAFLNITPLDYINIIIFVSGLACLMIQMGMWAYPPIAAIRSAAATLAFSLATQVIYLTKREGVRLYEVLKRVASKLLKTLEYFVLQTVEITLLLALLANIKALFTVTGLSHRLGTSLATLGKQNLPLLLLLSYVYAYLVGAGVPPLGTYVIIYATVIPALVRVGLNPWVAQFTAFFMSVHAEFAPPMSVAAATVSRVANVPYLSVVKELVKMGIALIVLIFITPFKPELVISPGLEQLRAGAIVALSIIGLETAFYGTLHRRKVLNALLKFVLLAGSVALLAYS